MTLAILLCSGVTRLMKLLEGAVRSVNFMVLYQGDFSHATRYT